MNDKRTAFDTLFHLDVNERVEKKKSGKNTLSYLSWAWAWAEVKKRYPEAQYEILKFENNKPYVFDEKTGYMVFTIVTIEDISHEMWLPVMDGANKAMKHESYKYTTKFNGEKTVEPATMFDINKTIMRCLVKNLAMFGLGLYIYSGEDIPEVEEEQKASKEEVKELVGLIKPVSLYMGKDYEVAEKTVLAKKNVNKKLNEITESEYQIILSYLNELINYYNENPDKKVNKDEKQEEITNE